MISIPQYSINKLIEQIRVGGTSTLTSNSVLTEQAYGGIIPQFGNVYQVIANSTGGAIRSSGAFGKVLFQNDSAATPVNNAAVVFDVNTGRLMTTGLNAPTSTFADLGGSNANQRRGASALLAGATRNVGIDQIDSSTQVGQATVTLLTTGDSLNRFVPTSYSSVTDYALLSNKVVSDILFSRPLSFNKSRGTKSDHFITDKNAYIGYTHNQYGFAGNSVNRNDFYLGTEAGNEILSVGALFLGSTGSIGSTYGHSSVDGFGGTGYVRGTLTPDLTLLGSVGYSNYNYTLSRSGLNGTANATTSSGSLNTDLGLTYLAFNQKGYSIQPRLGVSYGNASVKGFQEAGLTQGALGISGYNADRLSGQLGAVFAKDVELFSRPLKVALDVGVNEFFTDHKSNMNATVLADTSIKFPISSAQNTKVFGFAGLGANYQLTSSTSVYAKYEANTMNNNDSISNNATVEFKTSF
ncbi:MAG: autotransporter outer membrane beta-barrel domain-containing protein [Methylococcales bacterium]|nr:MAG: autotransporter outer membrane beta-barrel domain-containing protein [Methylococcales bacterium]